MQRAIEITVGGAGPYDPINLGTDCLIPSKRGVDLIVEERGVGTKKTSEIAILTAGGFRLLNGDKFHDGDIFFVYDAGVKYSTESSDWTNGFNLAQVIGALFGRIGWRQDTLDTAPVANGDNASSRSGRYFNDFHALCTLNNVKQLLDDAGSSDAEVNAFLESLQRGVIMQSLNGVLNEPESLELGFDFVRERETNDQAIAGGGKFVGRRIEPSIQDDVALRIDSVALYFDTDVTFPLYLFQEGKKAAIWTAEVSAIADEKTTVLLPDLVLSFLGTNNIGGAYYLGYFQADLGAAKAYDESRLHSCANLWSIEFIESDQAGDNFNRKLVSGSPYSHGLNVQLSAFRDWTNGIVKKQGLFDELLGLQMAGQILEKAIFSVRSNPTERLLKEQLLTMGVTDLLGITPGVPDASVTLGLRERIRRETARVRKSFYPNHKAITYTTK